MKYSELRKKLEKAGCYLPKHGANHDIYYSPKTQSQFPVGRHANEEVKKGTLNGILKQAGIHQNGCMKT